MLIYELEAELQERKDILYSEDAMTIKDFLDLGFNNSYIYLYNKKYNLGYKTYYIKSLYKSEDFSLNEKQLQCKIKIVDNGEDLDGFTIVYVRLVNEDDTKYFLNEIGGE